MRIALACLAAMAATPAGADTPDEGRRVFMQVCSACHSNDLSDAPQVKQPDAWVARLAKGRDALVHNALNGFTGPTGEEMPARGGRAELTDSQVSAAVDYIVSITTQKGKTP